MFRTEDGTQVFDEHGAEVAHDELDPKVIDPRAPTWEAFSEVRAEQARLESERAEILEFQERLDMAREEIADGEISEAELEALDAELMEAMPETVRSHVPDMTTEEPELDANTMQPNSTVEPMLQAPQIAVTPAPLP